MESVDFLASCTFLFYEPRKKTAIRILPVLGGFRVGKISRCLTWLDGNLTEGLTILHSTVEI